MKKSFLLLLALCCLTLPAQAAGFYDLPQTHWAAGEIQQAVDAGVVSGYGDGSFQPGRDVTAAHFCAMLCRSFLAEEYAAAPEGKHQAMDACLPVLAGTRVEVSYLALGKTWGSFVDQPLSRYDMAQIIYNLIAEKGGGLSAPDSVQSEIADWDEIPEGYRAAVSACRASGLLRGQGGGRFAGEDHLNRAQACVIWSRLDEFFGNMQDFTGGLPEEPAAEGLPGVEMPPFVLQDGETVQEMMRRVNHATPVCKDGCLPDGKPRTEENIQALLELVKQGCPDGTVWSGTDRFDYRVYHLGAVRGPLSFGMAATDFVFGEEAPVVTLRDFRSLAAGDVIHIRSAGAERVLLLTSVDYEEDTYTACELELNGKLNWSEWGPISGLIDAPNFTTAYRRWQ